MGAGSGGEQETMGLAETRGSALENFIDWQRGGKNCRLNIGADGRACRGERHCFLIAIY